MLLLLFTCCYLPGQGLKGSLGLPGVPVSTVTAALYSTVQQQALRIVPCCVMSWAEGQGAVESKAGGWLSDGSCSRSRRWGRRAELPDALLSVSSLMHCIALMLASSVPSCLLSSVFLPPPLLSLSLSLKCNLPLLFLSIFFACFLSPLPLSILQGAPGFPGVIGRPVGYMWLSSSRCLAHTVVIRRGFGGQELVC